MLISQRVAQRHLIASSVMYHTTTAENAVNILVDGLKPQDRGGFTTDYGDAAMMGYYQRRPAFLGVKPWASSGRWNVVLKVDVSGIPLAADIPLLVEMVGISYGELVLRKVNADGTEDDFIKPRPELIRALGPFAKRVTYKDGSYQDILPMDLFTRAGSAAAKAAIKVTGTAAVYATIPPDRITLKKRDRRIEYEVTVRKFEKGRPKELTMGDMEVLGDDFLQVFKDLKSGKLTEADVWAMIEAKR